MGSCGKLDSSSALSYIFSCNLDAGRARLGKTGREARRMAPEQVSDGGRAKPIHRRHGTWEGCPFETLDEVADFVSELSALLGEQGTDVPLWVSLRTDDREYRRVDPRDLDDLSLTISMASLTRFVVCSPDDTQPVSIHLTITTRRDGHSTLLDVEGSSQVAVEGINVWIARQIAGRIERGEEARKSTEKENHPTQAGSMSVSSWKRWVNHPWAIQVGGGAIAAVLAGGVIFFLSH